MALGVHSDEHFMKQALLEAEKASETGEIPVGVVIVANNRIIKTDLKGKLPRASNILLVSSMVKVKVPLSPFLRSE